MDKDTFKYNLDNLRKLHEDIEKQMIIFDEIIPFERQRTSKIYSPRLLNMMLAVNPQVESMTKLIAEYCGIKRDEKGIPGLISKINKKAVLSGLTIVSRIHHLLFTPFTLHIEWWTEYNGLKHDLAQNQFKINYTVVMDSFAALAGLHCLADKLNEGHIGEITNILDSKNWTSEEKTIRVTTYSRFLDKTPPEWSSLLFKITSVYFPPVNQLQF